MVSGFAHPGDHAVLRELEAEGRVRVWAGDGKDHGLLLAHLTPKRFRVVAGGGDAA